MIFHSKKGIILTLLNWILTIGSLFLPLAVFLDVGSIGDSLVMSEKILLTVICSLFTLFLLSGWFLTFYILTDTVLKVRGGFFMWKIPLNKIDSITATKNPLSAPALSLDRLQITYGNKFMLISPIDKDAFIKQITNKNPAIVINKKAIN